MSRFVQFTNEFGPVFVIPGNVTEIVSSCDDKTIIHCGDNATLVHEDAATVAKAIDDWFDNPSALSMHESFSLF